MPPLDLPMEFVCKLFNIESTGDYNFQNGVFAFCCRVVVECWVFLHSVTYSVADPGFPVGGGGADPLGGGGGADL